jgi:hypothetical protein
MFIFHPRAVWKQFKEEYKKGGLCLTMTEKELK